jgi:hypothetical protein
MSTIDTAMQGKPPVPDTAGEYATTKESSCQTCRHRSKVNPEICSAFPFDIPVPILMGEVEHKKPYKGDMGIQYEAL